MFESHGYPYSTCKNYTHSMIILQYSERQREQLLATVGLILQSLANRADCERFPPDAPIGEKDAIETLLIQAMRT